jgi:hypothetical protein
MIDYEIQNYAKLGLKEESATIGRQMKLGGLKFVWWGQSQWYKWRWHDTHADLGWLSIYGIQNPKRWFLLKWLMRPMRLYYHKRYVR